MLIGGKDLVDVSLRMDSVFRLEFAVDCTDVILGRLFCNEESVCYFLVVIIKHQKVQNFRFSLRQ